MNLRSAILCLLAILSINSFSQEFRTGYILEVRDNKVYLDLKAGEVEAGYKFQVFKEGGYFIHPVSGDSIKEEDNLISELEIIDVRTNYSIATASPSESVSLLKPGVKVIQIENQSELPVDDRKAVAIQPLVVTNSNGILGLYSTDLLTEILLNSNSYRVFDRQTDGLQADHIVVDSGIVLMESALLRYLSNIRADYYITGTFQTVVTDLSTETQIKPSYSYPGKSNVDPVPVAEYFTTQTKIKPLRAVVKITLQIRDIKTGEILLHCSEMQEYEGTADINIERGFLNGQKIPGGLSAFKNTATGKASELALQNLTNYFNDYFDGKITSTIYTGNVIENDIPLFKIMISDLSEKAGQDKMKLFSKPDTIYHASLNSGKNMSIRRNKYLNIYLSSDNSAKNSITQVKVEKIGYLRVSEASIDSAEGDVVFNYDFNARGFDYDASYLKIKNLWSTVFFISRVPTLEIKEIEDLEVIQKEIMYCGLGYMLNYKVGFYSYLGYGNTMLKTGTSSIFNTYYGGLGITKSIGSSTNIGAGLTIHYSKVKVLDSELIHSFDVLGSTRLKNNLTIVYGCSMPRGNQSNLFLSFGAGYSF